MSKKKKNKVTKQDIKLALILEEMLDYVPTDLKYNPVVDKFLTKTLGHGIITKEQEEQYEKLSDTSTLEDIKFNGIPNYIREDDITVWQASKITYEASKLEEKDRYPEAYKETASKKYTKTRKSA